MKNFFTQHWLVSMFMTAMAVLYPQLCLASGATSQEINNAIVLDGSIPLTWENDATYPWMIVDGKAQSGNGATANSTSTIKFKYSSQYTTTLQFSLQKNRYCSSADNSLAVYVDGEFRQTIGNYSTDAVGISFRLLKGNHSIEIKNTISDVRTPSDYTSCLWGVKVTENISPSNNELSTLLKDGSISVDWINDNSYPWTIVDGKVRNGNYGFPKSKSNIAFKYDSDNTTEVSFKVQKNRYSSSNDNSVDLYIDGIWNSELGNYSTYTENISFKLPKGEHTIMISDSIANHSEFDYTTDIWDIQVRDYGDLSNALLTSRSLPIILNDCGLQPWYIEDGCAKSNNYTASNSNSIIQAHLTVDKVSKLSFDVKSNYDNSEHKFRFSINGELYYITNNSNWNYVSVVLQPGVYDLEWKDENQYSGNSYYSLLKNVELHQDCVDVSITPGMLGVEVLYKVNVLTDVELLKVSGTLNDADWNAITMMTNLKSLDLGDAVLTEVPSKIFNNLHYLNTVALPDGVQAIGEEAFVKTNIYYLTIPSSVKSIGKRAFANTRLGNINFASNSELTEIGYGAFYRCAWLKEFIMPNSVTQLNMYYTDRGSAETFYGCTGLKKIHFSDALTYLPDYTCHNCSAVEEMHLPINLITIGDEFMYAANSLKELNFPASLRTIGQDAFAGLHQVKHLVLPEKLSSLGSAAFHNSAQIEIVELPSGVTSYNQTFRGCSNIKTIICRAATPPSVTYDAFSDVTKANVTLQVPSFAVATYKLDNYWYQFGNIIEGDPVDYWKIIGDLKLLNDRRMEGKPDIDLYYNGKLTVGGQATMEVGRFDIYTSDGNPSSLVTDCKNFTADEINTIYHVDANKWYFITPMVDIDLRQVNVTGTPNYVFRYYDGATRADIGAGTSWKNVSDMTLKSGVGYIFQCNAASDVIFPVPVEMRSRVLTTEAISIPLTAHPSDNAANKGWNYVGNPFPSYYDIYYMDFTAPITVWTGSTYRAYSVTDDNYVLRPMQGFFVQKPDAVDVITLQPAGRQIASSVSRAAKVVPKSRADVNAERYVFDLEISADTVIDVTRVVLNNNASFDYEVERDASKFMSMDSNVPQIYTIDKDNNHLAINERPESEIEIPIGVYIPIADTPYSIEATRIDGEAYLYDAVTNATHNLSSGAYEFLADNGTIENRFTLKLKQNASSGIESIEKPNASVEIISTADAVTIKGAGGLEVRAYGLDGIMLYSGKVADNEITISLSKGVYIIVVDNMTYKVVVK